MDSIDRVGVLAVLAVSFHKFAIKQNYYLLTITMHSGATPLLSNVSLEKYFCQKIFDISFSFQATEMVLTSKWGRIQPEIQI